MLGPAAGQASPQVRVSRSGAAVAVAAMAVALAAVAGCGGDDAAGGATQTSRSPIDFAPTTSPASPSPSPPAGTATGGPSTQPQGADPAVLLWPVASGGLRYRDPAAAALGFATGLAGFQGPVAGAFKPTGDRSGEVPLRPTATGPVTRVFVRGLADGTWWVTGSAAATIRLDSPSSQDVITSPVRLAGAAHTFEGHVAVTIRADGQPTPLGTGFVTGAGDQLGPFSGEVTFTRTPTQRYGAIVLTEPSAKDGSTVQTTVVRVRF
jgi:hypothetical protein